MQLTAIYTGDIIDSRSLSVKGRKLMLQALEQGHIGIVKRHKKAQFEISRGDSFQGNIPNPSSVLGEVLYLKSLLMSTHTDSEAQLNMRCGIGIGQVEYPGENLASSDGTAFRLAGDMLDGMPSKQELAIATPMEDINEELDVQMKLLHAITSRWTREMAEVICMSLEGKTQTAIGSQLGIGQSAVNHRLRLARYEVLAPLFTRFEKLVTRLNKA